MSNDDYAALTAYTAQFRGETVEETALAEYEGKRYHIRGFDPLSIFVIDERYTDPYGWMRFVNIESGKEAFAFPEALIEAPIWL